VRLAQLAKHSPLLRCLVWRIFIKCETKLALTEPNTPAIRPQFLRLDKHHNTRTEFYDVLVSRVFCCKLSPRYKNMALTKQVSHRDPNDFPTLQLFLLGTANPFERLHFKKGNRKLTPGLQRLSVLPNQSRSLPSFLMPGLL
jgi:hypothetical protein